MRSGKTTEITIDTHEVWIIRRVTPQALVGCADCDDQLTMVTVDQAVEITRISARAIYRWVESGQLHFWETVEGRLYVCLNSLPSSPQAVDLQPR